jgi:NADH-quinone oxidoreductase subunit G
VCASPREISKTNALGIQERGDHSLVRAAEDGSFDKDAYSDNVVDICPVGALLSRSFLHRARVWYLEPTPSVCPGCSRGCTVNLWHRKREWKLHALDPARNTSIERVTPLENPQVNGPWICVKGRDLAKIFERPRATQAMSRDAGRARRAARPRAAHRAASGRLRCSSWGSNEELAPSTRVRRPLRVREGRLAPQPARWSKTLLIRADKNPNNARAARLPSWRRGLRAGPTSSSSGARLRPRALRDAKTILDGYDEHHGARGRVSSRSASRPTRRGHYTNFEGVVSAFSPCFAAAPSVADAEALFAALVAVTESAA